MTSSNAPRRLFRRPDQGRVAGVCAGLAEYLNADVTVVRLAWVILSIVPGGFIGGIVAYVVAWLIMPESSEPVSAEALGRLTRSPTDRKIGGVCGGIAEFLGIDSTVIRVVWMVLTIFPGAIVFGVVAYLIAWLIMPERPLGSVATAQPAAS